jgi:murein DD-endopeptidase MepM/ murein hydrolase activator NlpD
MSTSNRPTQWLRLIGLLLLAGAAIYALTQWLGREAARGPEAGTQPVPVDLAALDDDGLPLYAFVAVDPALLPALAAAGEYGAADPLGIASAGVLPIGIYLPATGNQQFALPAPTPTPALTPLPTSTPLVMPTAPAGLGFLPSPTPTPVPPPSYLGGPPPEDYGGEGCAPAGWPAPGVLTQYYKWYHRGIDIGVPLGTPVVATHSGTVKFAGWRTDGYGNLIIIENGAFITYYAHLTEFNVVEGQQVGKGSLIGWSGSTGNSTGPHIHYEIRINNSEVDPLSFEKRGYGSC